MKYHGLITVQFISARLNSDEVTEAYLMSVQYTEVLYGAVQLGEAK